jgi:hypothetical protein
MPEVARPAAWFIGPALKGRKLPWFRSGLRGRAKAVQAYEVPRPGAVR